MTALAEATPVAVTNTAKGAPQSLLRFLTCGSVDDGKSTLIGRLSTNAALSLKISLSRWSAIQRSSAPTATISTLRCSSTGSARNESRASRSTSPTAISLLRAAPSSSPIRPVTNNIRATWRQVRQLPISPSCSSMRAKGFCRRRDAMPSSIRCCACAISLLPSTRWILSASIGRSSTR